MHVDIRGVSFCFIFIICIVNVSAESYCNVRAYTESGWVCGLKRPSATGGDYASFRGVPYAKQPIGKLRFKELQLQEPWKGDFIARDEGPTCVQHLNIYGDLLQPEYGMSEACIHANIHVPIDALPHDNNDEKEDKDNSLPVVVFIHGGGYSVGSGDADLHGPEYLVSKGVIVMTFNYRINVFGFLSLNTSSIPGNNGLRDMVTFLRWVQRNAHYFGGNPHDVTLMGNSVGANCAQLLTLSDAAKGLFKRVYLSSGTALPVTFTSSPAYAAAIAARFLYTLGISATDPDKIHDILTKLPIERIIHANSLVQSDYGIVAFSPVIETKFPGVTTIIDREPEESLTEGHGKEYPIIIGYNTNECEFFRANFDYARYWQRILANPRVVLPFEIAYTLPPNVTLALGQKVKDRCFKRKPTLDEIVKCYSENLFVYPAYRMARIRAEVGGAPIFLYQFSYEAQHSLIKEGLHTNYRGTSHVEDQTYFLKANSLRDDNPIFPTRNKDDMMRDWLTMFIINFIKCDNPTCKKPGWPRVEKNHLFYENIEYPMVYNVSEPTIEQRDLIAFYDDIYRERYRTKFSEMYKPYHFDMYERLSKENTPKNFLLPQLPFMDLIKTANV